MLSRKATVTRWLLTALLLCLASVAGSASAQSFSLSTGGYPYPAYVCQGCSSNWVAIVSTVSGGFNQSISFTASNLPAGVTASFTSLPAPGSGTATMTLTATSAAVAGTYTVTVTGTGGGVTKSMTVTVEVYAFSVAASPASINLQPGASGSVAITCSLGSMSIGAPGPTSGTATGQPSGVTVQLGLGSGYPCNPTETMTITVASTVITGVYPIAVSESFGFGTATTTVMLTVLPAISGTANTIAMFTGPSSMGNSVITQSSGTIGIGGAALANSFGFNSTGSGTFTEACGTNRNGQQVGCTLPTYGLGWGEPYYQTAYTALSGQGGINLYTNNTRIMTLTSAGTVGIGTTTPDSNLVVQSASGSSPTVEFRNSDYVQGTTGSGVLIGMGSSSGNTYGAVYAFKNGNSGYGNLYLGNGNVGIGTTSPAYALDVAGQIHSSAGMVFSDGTAQTTAWTGVLCGGDYAEDMRATGSKAKYEPGDVLVIADGNNSDVQKSAQPYSTMVAGIYASKPGVVGRRAEVAQSTNNIPMAMVGVVPTKVTTENGPIHRGDLLVTSSAPGYAMKGTDRDRMLGAVIGKAMGPLEHGTGVIEVLVTLQ